MQIFLGIYYFPTNKSTECCDSIGIDWLCLKMCHLNAGMTRPFLKSGVSIMHISCVSIFVAHNGYLLKRNWFYVNVIGRQILTVMPYFEILSIQLYLNALAALLNICANNTDWLDWLEVQWQEENVSKGVDWLVLLLWWPMRGYV